MLSGKALFALGTAGIAGMFVALLITSRGPTNDQIDENDRLEKFGEQQAKRVAGSACHDSVRHAIAAAEGFLVSTYGEGAPEEVRELAEHRCVADGWSSEIVGCLNKVTSDNEMQRCIGRLDDNQRRALEAEMKAFAARPRIPVDADVDADPYVYDNDPFAIGDVDAAVAVPGDLPPACASYQEMMERMAVCDGLPQASRDALKQGLDAMRQGWSNLAQMPEAARSAMNDACKQASSAIEQVGKASCGW